MKQKEVALFYFYSFISADSGAFCLLFLAWDAGVDGLIHEIDLWARGVVFTISDQPFGQDLRGCVCDVCKVGKSNWYCIPVPQLMMVVVGASKNSFSVAKTPGNSSCPPRIDHFERRGWGLFVYPTIVRASNTNSSSLPCPGASPRPSPPGPPGSRAIPPSFSLITQNPQLPAPILDPLNPETVSPGSHSFWGLC